MGITVMWVAIMDNQRMNECVVCEGLPRTSPTGVSELNVHYPYSSLMNSSISITWSIPSNKFTVFFFPFSVSDLITI